MVNTAKHHAVRTKERVREGEGGSAHLSRVSERGFFCYATYDGGTRRRG